jgi:hypothetical protein
MGESVGVGLATPSGRTYREDGMSALPSRSQSVAGACVVALGALVALVAAILLAPRPISGHGLVTPKAAGRADLALAAPRGAVPRRPAIEAVPPSPPLAFTLTGPRFTIKAHVCAMANVRPYDPPGEQHHTVCWVRSGFGAAPGTGQRTAYLFGHAWAEDPAEVLNKASELATREILHARAQRVPTIAAGEFGLVPPEPTTAILPVRGLNGYRLVLRTHTGVLTYQVRQAYGVDKYQLGYVADWEHAAPRNRVILTTCAELDGVDYEYNVVLVAFLTAAHPLHEAVPKS